MARQLLLLLTIIKICLLVCIPFVVSSEFHSPPLSKEVDEITDKEDDLVSLKVDEGDSIILECHFPKIVGRRIDHVFIWLHDQRTASVDSIVHSNNFKLANSIDLYKKSYDLQILKTIKKIHAGTYKCLVARQNAGMIFSMTYNLIVIPPLKNMVIRPPYPITGEGSSVTLTCQVEGNGEDIQVSWLVNRPMGWFYVNSTDDDDAEVTLNPSDPTISTLLLKNVRRDKEIMCLARNLKTRGKKWVERFVSVKIRTGEVENDDEDPDLSLTIQNLTSIDRGTSHILFGWNPFYVEAFGGDPARYTIVYSLLFFGGPKNDHFDCGFESTCNLTELDPDSSYAVQVFASTIDWRIEPTKNFKFTTLPEKAVGQIGEKNVTSISSDMADKKWMIEKLNVSESKFDEVNLRQSAFAIPNEQEDKEKKAFLRFLGDCLIYFGGMVLGLFFVGLMIILLVCGKMVVCHWWHQIQPVVWV